ncbi:hypothetical protein PC110_g11254 [Phytophthora cactorum]|uniref:RxLR effector PexRD54 WY domain-containing protein n=2 Tax=Phytophthora cactorum TaxID=29920 RepID=A0A329S685_9STRA|nr:hypothetical protein PC110_g11254 [Phytophthora cactorum]
MRLYGVVLLGVTALLARINASSDAEAATTSFAVAEHGVSTARSLRIGYITKEDDEERMVNVKSLVGADTISRSVSFDTLRAAKSDTVLSQLLIAWKKIPDMEKVATSWQNMQLQTWLESGVSPQKVFKYLMLDDEAGNLFTSPQFKTWLDYSMDFKKANPRADTATVIDTLAAHYSDTALARIIKTAKADPTTKIRGAFFENALLGKWVKDGKSSTYISNMLGRQVTPDDAFKLLSLDRAADNIFARSEYSTWLKYAIAFKRENPDVETKSVIGTLLAYHNDENLSRIIKMAEQTSTTKKMAAYIKNALLDEWVKANKAPAYVVNKLGTSSDDRKELLNTYLNKIKALE